jgi:polyisoprenoid-binding protein YceI
MTTRPRLGRSPWTLSLFAALVFLLAAAAAASAKAAEEIYNIDTKGQHAFIEFRIKHLGYSWLYGRFNEFGGNVLFDRDDPANSSVTVEIDTASVDTNHAERDKHIRSGDFLNVDKHPTATFVSTSVKSTGEGTADISGNLTLNGVTKPVLIAASFVGQGDDPWGGYRAGFSGNTTLKLKDFDIQKDLGPASQDVELIISVEGVRQ